MIDLSTMSSSLFPAVLLGLSATLLSRAKEIDLSLDQQCFFVAAIQVCLTAAVPAWLAVLISWVVLAACQSGKLVLNRLGPLDPLVTSVAAALMYMGAGVLLIWYLSPGSQYPQYKLDLPPLFMYAVATLFIFSLICADHLVAAMHRSTFYVRPFGAVPSSTLSVFASIWPSAAATCLAGAILGLHAGSVTPAFSHGFGILAATAAIVAYGRLAYGILIGLALGSLYTIGIVVATTVGDEVVQSYLVQVGTFGIVGLWALLISRRRI